MTVNVTKPQINVREKLSELDKPSGIAGEAILRSETPQEVFNYINAGRRNLIINGAMQVAQRGTSSTGQTSAGYKTCDRFNTFIASAGTWTITQSTDAPAGFATSMKYDCTTANASLSSSARMDHQQRFEGQDLQHLAKGTSEAVPLTLSFWVKSNKTGTYVAELFDNDNNRQISQAYSINASDTWEHKILTFAGDTSGALGNDNGNSFQVNWFLAAGSNLTSGTLNTSWASSTTANRAVGQVNLANDTANDWYITGVQLEVGSVATPFEHRSYGEELALCERYYWRTQTGNENGGASVIIAAGGTNSEDDKYVDLYGQPVMRAQPTVSLSGNLSDFDAVRWGVAWDPITGWGTHQTGYKHTNIRLETGINASAYSQTAVRNTADAFFALDAEL